MNLFVIAAGAMAVILLVAGWQRPRLAVLVAAILWLLYAIYERLVATGVLCDADFHCIADTLPARRARPATVRSGLWREAQKAGA